MKKLFNLAVIFAALTAAFTFSSCNDDEDDAIDEAVSQNLDYVKVSVGDKIYFANTSVGEDGKGGVIEITNVVNSATDKKVGFKVATKKDEQKKQEFEIGQGANDPSYVLWIGGEFKTGMQPDAKANPGAVVFCLASDPTELSGSFLSTDCVLTSASINGAVKAAAAASNITLVNTKFGKK